MDLGFVDAYGQKREDLMMAAFVTLRKTVSSCSLMKEVRESFWDSASFLYRHSLLKGFAKGVCFNHAISYTKIN